MDPAHLAHQQQMDQALEQVQSHYQIQTPQPQPQPIPVPAHAHFAVDQNAKRRRRPRRVKSQFQAQLLRRHFASENRPDRNSINALSQATGLTPGEVRAWFRQQRKLVKKTQVQQQHLQPMPEPPPPDVHSHLNPEQDQDQPVIVDPEQPIANQTQGEPDDVLKIKDQKTPQQRKLWRPTNKFREARDAWRKGLDAFSNFLPGSREREELLKEMIGRLNKPDRALVNEFLQPRGPYRPCADPKLSRDTLLERCKQAWGEMERRFGVHKSKKQAANGPNAHLSVGNGAPQPQQEGQRGPPQPSQIPMPDQRTFEGGFEESLEFEEGAFNPGPTLDPNMMVGLKTMFRSHRDYLYTIAKELEVTETLRSEVRTEMKNDLAKQRKRARAGEKAKKQVKAKMVGGLNPAPPMDSRNQLVKRMAQPNRPQVPMGIPQTQYGMANPRPLHHIPHLAAMHAQLQQQQAPRHLVHVLPPHLQGQNIGQPPLNQGGWS